MAITTEAIDSIHLAIAFLQDFEIAYTHLVKISTAIDLYSAETDPVFNGTVDAAIDISVVTDILYLKFNLDSFIADWDTNYSGLIHPA